MLTFEQIWTKEKQSTKTDLKNPELFRGIVFYTNLQISSCWISCAYLLFALTTNAVISKTLRMWDMFSCLFS